MVFRNLATAFVVLFAGTQGVSAIFVATSDEPCANKGVPPSVATASPAAALKPAPAEWTPLLDAALSRWEPFLGVPRKKTDVPGYVWDKNTPVGLRDPLGIFAVRTESGEPVLHVSGQVLGGLTTLENFANYHLRFQYRWLEKKWPPREKAPRDSGLLYHCVGLHGAHDKVWMRSVELQVQENDTGDFWPLCGSGADFPSVREGKFPRYTPGAPLTRAYSRVLRGADYQEKPHGEWNTVELLVVGADSKHVLNGRVVNELRNIHYVEKGAQSAPLSAGERALPCQPLTFGKLQIQSEYAEVEFRRIEIKHLSEFPKEP